MKQSFDRIRFHLDEHIAHAIADALRTNGIDVTTTNEAGLRGAADEEHLAFARREWRVIVTDDADFLRLAASTSDHAGIAVCDRLRMSTGQIVRALLLVHGVLTSEEMRGHVEYLV